MIFTVTKKARPKQSSDMNFKAWDNNEAACGLPFRLLLVLKICGRLWHGVTSGSERGFPCFSYAFLLRSGLRRAEFDSPLLGMKEGCSGENVLERER